MYKKAKEFFKKNGIDKIFYLFFSFIIFLLLLTMWSIFESLSSFKNESINKNSNNRIVSIEFDETSISDEEKAVISMDEIKLPTKKDYEQLSKSKEISSFEIYVINSFFSSNIIDISDVKDKDYGYFTFKGISENQSFDFTSNNVKIVEGRMLTKEEIENESNSIIISKQVADNNNLKIGDIFNMDIFNYKNENQIYKQELKIVGIFEPNWNLNKQKEELQILSDFTKQMFPKNDTMNDHKDNNEEHIEKDLIQHKQSEFEDILEVKSLFLISDVNNIYMSNNTILKMSENIANKFNLEDNCEYRATYELNTNGSIEAFRQELKNIIPNYFTAYGINEAFTSWMPHTSNNIFLTGIICCLLLILTLVLIGAFTITYITKRKVVIQQHILIGKSLSYPFKLFFRNNVLIILAALISASYFAINLAKYAMLKYFTFVGLGSGTYYNVQFFYRDLVDVTRPLYTYVKFDYCYFNGILFLFILSILSTYCIQIFIKKKILEGVSL